MPMEFTSLPGGTVAVAAIAYVAFSGTVSGPEIGNRMIEQSGWPARCETTIREEIMSRAPTAYQEPKIGCEMTFGLVVPNANFCDRHQDFTLEHPLIDMVFDQHRRVVEADRARVAARADKAGSQCSCAHQMFLEERRWDLALYVGSAGLVTPPALNDLDASLSHALRSPHCALTVEADQ